MSSETGNGKENKTPLVIFMPSGRRGHFAKGTPVIEAARSLGVYIESVCGGRGICGRCQIEVSQGHFSKHQITSSNENLSPFSAKEKRYAEKRTLKPARRLSCSSTIEGDLVVDIPADLQINAQVVRKQAEERTLERDPAVQLCYVEVEEPDMENPFGDADRLIRMLERDWGYKGLVIETSLLAEVQNLLRKGDWSVTAAVHQDITHPTVIALWPGLQSKSFGLSVDIGSTTIAMHLTDLSSGHVLASSGNSNPQIRFGEDLMSRVSYIQMNPKECATLTMAVRETINDMIAEVTNTAGIDKEHILEAVFVGNPVMHHLFLGIDPAELGGAPFALAVSGALHLCARELDLDLVSSARVYVLPCIAGHVGADAAAVALSEAPYRSDDMTLVVDIGTNAEILLGNKERLLAASSPTGPAFEGAEISCGQRAAPGAIERVRIDESFEPRVRVIGSELWSDEEGFEETIQQYGVTGVCGSGIIEAIAEMYRVGLISEDGVVRGDLATQTDRITEQDRTFSYRLWSGTPELLIRQTDVRAIQLAKAALYAGVKLLMDRLGCEAIARVRLAGAFGNFIDPKYAMILGLVPDCALENVSSAGNAAGMGARMALVNRKNRREIEETVRKIEKVETALAPRFQEHFIAAMAFPNKVDGFPVLRSFVELPVKNKDAARQDKQRNTRRRKR